MNAPRRPDPTERFSERATHYAKYRPGYPEAVLDTLYDEVGLTPGDAIADIGSGTGILSKLLLDRGMVVYGVEPNEAMRAGAEAALGSYTDFHSVAGSAEATTLPPDSVDGIVAGQAFHWFDAARCREEILRVGKTGVWCGLVWNLRRTEHTRFACAYEAFLERWGTDYERVRSTYADETAIATLFGGDRFTRHAFPNEQAFDAEGLRGRLLSSSYVPGSGDPRQAKMLDALDELFSEHERAGRVTFEYDTVLYCGQLGT